MRGRLLLPLCVVGGQRGLMFGLFRSLFFRGQDSTHDGAIQFVSDVYHLPIVSFLTDGEGRQVAFFPEILMASLYREVAFQIALAISGFIAMLRPVPGKDSNLIEVPRQSVLGLVQQLSLIHIS